MTDLTFFKTKFHIYPESIHHSGDLTCFLIDAGDRDRLCVAGQDPAFPGEPRSQSGYAYTVSELDHAAAVFLRDRFPFCAPASVLDRKTTFGAGDRLGSLSPGKDADLVVMDGHPFHWRTRVTHVLIDGQEVI